MARTVSIGAQGFENIRKNNLFYVDKTGFMSDWWNSHDDVTLICRPRRFGKTLNLDTVRCFFSTEFAGRGEELFGGLDVWQDPKMQKLQGTIPVVSISFADIKSSNYKDAMSGIRINLRVETTRHRYLLESDKVSRDDQSALTRVSDNMDDVTAARALQLLCRALYAHWGTKPIVLLDEYDTPMQEAWVGGYWDEMSSFMRSLMNSTFKSNPSLGRALMTGITRVSRESMFSDLNNLRVLTVSSDAYQSSFGFTEDEVKSILVEFDMSNQLSDIKAWYDGFRFGGLNGIYNPWSITCLLKEHKLQPYWMNTSSNALAADVVRQGSSALKKDFETLLAGDIVTRQVSDQIVFSDLSSKPDAVWGLLLASGYLTTTGEVPENATNELSLKLTNYEVQLGFDDMISRWFGMSEEDYDDFIGAVLKGDVKAANHYLSDVTLACISSFDGATKTAESQPERFYHGLVLGMLAKLRGLYTVESNRESGWGRYDIMLVPLNGATSARPAVIIEFKVFDPDEETTLQDTVERALAQIKERAYATALIERGVSAEHILSYGMAFRGKEVLVSRA
ncbi:MAG: AAA family ATPase [Atopobiaceae bacterium]|nr:AAA family ATPase [Atopobiaceae bacterium]